MNYKKISIITPVYNSEKYLEQTIASIVNQNYPNFEYIIIDGGSSDNSLDIIKKYEKYITKWISEKDKGMYHALKKGFELASGEIYGWINSDDILMPGALYSVNKTFSEIEDCHWVTGIPSNLTADGIVYFGSQTHFKREYNKEEYLNCKSPYAIQQESTFFSANLYKKTGGISTDYKLAGDYELWAKFFQYEKLNLINSYIGAFRFHGNQLSSNIDKYLEEVNCIRKIYNSKDIKARYDKQLLKKILMKFLPCFLSKRIDEKDNLYLIDKKLNKFIKSNRW
ncbi:glycosyltransferase family 2 protein [Arcobacter arenosus]|uniref:glycosyltransferase family 2 protein n=1 Tax=Arcobacter arenosus TaxID=2576037 RepID=UPI003BAD7B5E